MPGGGPSRHCGHQNRALLETADLYSPILLCDIFVIYVATVVSVGWADAFAANIIKALEMKGWKTDDVYHCSSSSTHNNVNIQETHPNPL